MHNIHRVSPFFKVTRAKSHKLFMMRVVSECHFFLSKTVYKKNYFFFLSSNWGKRWHSDTERG